MWQVAARLLRKKRRVPSPQALAKVALGTVAMPSISTGEINGHISHRGVSLSELPKSHVFTTHLPPDPVIPSPEASKSAPREHLRMSRPVKSALFTWVAPEKNNKFQLLAISWKALRDLGLDPREVESEEFLNLMSGNKIYEEHYPWGTL
jgi:serine/tyrosine/threonine adenylyltransferase